MRLTSCTALLAFLVLLVGIATAFPISFEGHNRHLGTTSPHIFCVTWDDRKLCEKFELPVVRGQSTAPSTHSAYPSTVIGSSPLVTEEDRQIRRIMDVKEDANVIKSRQPWLVPDVQVVLWFVLLCCLTEGILSGIRWWQQHTPSQGYESGSRERRGKTSLAAGESDEDDEANIPVL